MNINRRRNFRPRQQKNNFRRRNGSMTSNNSISYNNGNSGFNRNSAMNNIHSVEKTMIKFQQLAKDAQSNGDPVLSQNYLQHADHYLRRFNELSAKKEIVSEKQVSNEKYSKDENTTKELKQKSNS